MKVFVTLIIVFSFLSGCQNLNTNSVKKGSETIEFKAYPFDIKDVKLLEGPFHKATSLNIESLLSYDPDRFLARFRIEAGLEPKAEPYSGWEGQSLAGHSLGHYLSACALMHQTTGNEEFLKRVDYIVNELALCQEANGGHYIGAFSRTSINEQNIGEMLTGKENLEGGQWVFENEIAKGIIIAAPFSLNGIWAPFYTHHKVLAGLRDAYLLSRNELALKVSTRFADWIFSIVENLNHEQIQEMLICEYGGINEVFAELYGITGNVNYLTLSRLFHDDKVLVQLEQETDILSGNHANTQIPKVAGLARRYELTGNLQDYKASVFFWNTVVNNHTYVTGGNGNEEYFGNPGELRDRLGPNTTESCNVYNMLRLTRNMFQWEANAQYADYYERALLNHIMSSQHPLDGRVIYNLDIDMGGNKYFQNPLGFTCCVGTGMENHSKYGEAIYFKNKNDLYITQFIGSELTWQEKGVIVRQETHFPEAEKTVITIKSENPVKFNLKIRKPHWAGKEFRISINGKSKKADVTNEGFVSVKRKWTNGDEIIVDFPFSLRLESMPDDPDRVAFFHGPILLAGILGPSDDNRVTEPDYVPVILTDDRNLNNWLEELDGYQLFRTTNAFPRNVELRPFNKVYDERYTLFWDVMTKDQLIKKQALDNQRRDFAMLLDSCAFELIIPKSASEKNEAGFTGEKTSVRKYKERLCREAERGGWFGYEMAVSGNQPNSIVVEYWGGFEGSRTFDIVVEGETIATENISNKKSGHFLLVKYEIPYNLTQGKKSIQILFKPHEFHRAGPVFSIRTIPADLIENESFVL
jgi:uncharacterized protein